MDPGSNGHSAMEHRQTATTYYAHEPGGHAASSQLVALGSSPPTNGRNGFHSGGPGGQKNGSYAPVPKQPHRRPFDNNANPDELIGRTR
jgi:hypothetical protein